MKKLWHLVGIVACIGSLSIEAKKRFVLVIDPAGSLHTPGRKLPDGFERGPTLQCAEKLKHHLEKNYNIDVVLTRSAQSTTTQQHNAQLANRLQADAFIHLSFFAETEVKPRIYLYTYNTGNDFPLKTDALSLCPYDRAHCYALPHTTAWAEKALRTLKETCYATHPVIHAPYAPLKGIKSSALGIEIGLHKAHNWSACIEPLSAVVGLLVS